MATPRAVISMGVGRRARYLGLAASPLWSQSRSNAYFAFPPVFEETSQSTKTEDVSKTQLHATLSSHQISYVNKLAVLM